MIIKPSVGGPIIQVISYWSADIDQVMSHSDGNSNHYHSLYLPGILQIQIDPLPVVLGHGFGSRQDLHWTKLTFVHLDDSPGN